MRNADINWLPNHLLKNIPDVKVIYEESVGQSYGGYYTYGSNEIVVVADGTEQSTIAHEFRHFLQYNKGLLKDEEGSIWKMIGTYEESIHKYFWSYWWEMDALLFQYKYSKDEVTEWWLKKLVMRR